MRTIEKYLDSAGSITTAENAATVHRVTVDDNGSVTQDEIFI